MPSVHDLTHEMLRRHGVTNGLDNPRSNELQFLKDFPSGFRHFLCLHEGAAVGTADVVWLVHTDGTELHQARLSTLHG